MDKESLEQEVVSKGVFVAGPLWKCPFLTNSLSDEDRRLPKFLKYLPAKTFDWV